MPPATDWLYAYGMVRCANPACRDVYREHYEMCGKCGTPRVPEKTAEEEHDVDD